MDVGGFPEVYLFQKEMAARIYEDIIYKDIISRHDIRTAIPVLSLTAFF
jgi:predicted AAA+ superfamily ATPase